MSRRPHRKEWTTRALVPLGLWPKAVVWKQELCRNSHCWDPCPWWLRVWSAGCFRIGHLAWILQYGSRASSFGTARFRPRLPSYLVLFISTRHRNSWTRTHPHVLTTSSLPGDLASICFFSSNLVFPSR